MLVTALAVARFIYEREPSLGISLLLLFGAGAIVVQARFSAACARAAARGVRVPPRSLVVSLFLVLLATVVLAFALMVGR